MPRVILIVEDHETLRRTLQSWIAASFPDCTCAEAASGEEAIALSTAESPAVVLMDFELPGVNGIDAMRQMKALCPAARFIVMSQHDMTQIVRSAEDAGAHVYLAKQDINVRLLRVLQEQLAEAA
jgi:two-component system, NarL family, invasion response regulator UvrY